MLDPRVGRTEAVGELACDLAVAGKNRRGELRPGRTLCIFDRRAAEQGESQIDGVLKRVAIGGGLEVGHTRKKAKSGRRSGGG